MQPEDIQLRLDRAQQGLQARGLDALLVTPGPDLRYLVGYDAVPLERLTCLVIPAQGQIRMVVPRLEEPDKLPRAHLCYALLFRVFWLFRPPL